MLEKIAVKDIHTGLGRIHSIRSLVTDQVIHKMKIDNLAQ